MPRFGGTAGESELTTNLLHDVPENIPCFLAAGSSYGGDGSVVAYSHNSSSDNNDSIYRQYVENSPGSRDDGDDMLYSFEQGQGGGGGGSGGNGVSKHQVRGFTTAGIRCDSDCGFSGSQFESYFSTRRSGNT